jgi:DNA-binding NarL/FixJ family response regulator
MTDGPGAQTMGGAGLRVLVADDHAMLVEMLALHLATVAGFAVVTAHSLDSALERMEAGEGGDVALLDLDMPGMNGVAGLRRALRANRGRPVGILTGGATPRMAETLVAAGAAGLVLKTAGVRSLANAIRFMHAGERYLPLDLMRAARVEAEEGRGALSGRERAVLAILAEGRQNKEIAGALRLAEPTVKMHVTAICRKLGALNRTQAVLRARDLGLV